MRTTVDVVDGDDDDIVAVAARGSRLGTGRALGSAVDPDASESLESHHRCPLASRDQGPWSHHRYRNGLKKTMTRMNGRRHSKVSWTGSNRSASPKKPCRRMQSIVRQIRPVPLVLQPLA